VERGAVKLRSVEALRVAGEVQASGKSPAYTASAEWIGGTGPLALRSLCTCGATGICEHVIAILETVRTAGDGDGEDESLNWLPQPVATIAVRRARSLWVVFSPLEAGLSASLVLDSPRLRGATREAASIVAMMESTPPDDWDDIDRVLLREEIVLEAFNGKQAPKALSRAMLRLSGHPRLRYAPDQRSELHPSELGEFAIDLRGLRLMATADSEGFLPTLRSRDNEKVDPATLILLDTVPMWAATHRTAYLLDDSFDIKSVMEAARRGKRTPVSLQAVTRVAPYLSKNDRNQLGITDAERPGAEVALTWLDGALIASITFIDRATKARAPFHSNGAIAQKGSGLLFFARSVADRIDARLTQAGFVPRGADRYAMHGAERAASFVRDLWPTWTDLDRRIDRTLEDLTGKATYFNVSVSVRPGESGEANWFEMNVGVELEGGEKLTAAEIETLLAGSGRYADLRGRLVDVSGLRDRGALLADLANRRHTGLAATLAIYDELRAGVDHVDAPREVVELRERLRNFSGIEPVTIPESVNAVLRPYQKRGVDFLAYLESFQFSGVLADEMGLGKTLQVIAYLLWRKERDGPMPTLVIAPTSVTHTWQSEIARFAPELSVLRFQSGPERAALYQDVPNVDVLITSYALARLDAEKLASMRFRVVVLDEAQHAKNPSSQIARVVRALHSDQRLALTGTPVENALRDLWAIFSFVEPGLLGTESGFRRRFELPIASGDEQAAAMLRSRLEPFLIRRTKEDVATELPDRIEAVVECELSPLQRRLYQGVAEAARRDILGQMDSGGLEGATMHVLAALTRLRQICAHPGLLFDEYRDVPEASAKLDAFLETVEDVIDSGHKVLAFSAFSSMLKIIRSELARRGYTCAYLDGSTKDKDRQYEVNRFMADDGPPIFICSLKAGGVGLTLTAADYVILYDPWWNPAVERQAIDRAHRIGQRRVVTAYRMITQGTVEEKMRQLAERKSALSKSVIRADSAIAKSLSRDDLELLFADPA
jgi:superfamily II DNA or RNA helicase